MLIAEDPSECALVYFYYSYDLGKIFHKKGLPTHLSKTSIDPGNPLDFLVVDEPAPVVMPEIHFRGELREMMTGLCELIRDLNGVRFPHQRDFGHPPDLSEQVKKDNIRYMEGVLAQQANCRMTIFIHAGTEEICDYINRLQREGRKNLIPLPEMHIYVATNGVFVGALFKMPDESSPRHTTYVTGIPSWGVAVRIEYERYTFRAANMVYCRPLNYQQIEGERGLNDAQRRAIEAWIQDREDTYQTLCKVEGPL